ncbi:DUF3307 domain-containing protein [Thioclava litoralis]|uniref:DUF3307 domain-containing protein n=1 Tax=Thioclava litoralis TaxID=3076557 RepID=A0ABZ1E1E1_9RHOB|nr:DUF3307 domain-containing protein [Thioclava sp. FTW29]
MIAASLAALLLAHLLGDFVFQSTKMAEKKASGPLARRLPALARHMGVHALLLALLLPAPDAQGALAFVAILASHFLIDALKPRLRGTALRVFLADQAAHWLVICALALTLPDLWAHTLWMKTQSGLATYLPTVFALVAGAVLTVRMGGFVIGALMQPLAERAPQGGLPKGGQLIGLLERALIFVLILTGQPQGIGFLIAAKSILRFEAKGGPDHNAANEYVIIGTLASFGWAIACAYLTLGLLAHLPPIGIPALGIPQHSP